ncbi:M20/M25/M40 family metallo-hydrolase [Faecalibacter bovis]|uniref:M20/M25/M40 family metallo-hydrolase n=1 Tax=Faecalibacter bovis TaxID=2898187 RepID=A0ABX7XG31_9FLAO|nr:M20/M25/M40 family metallo-hydrolase [Faecalibacter bovis]QTV06903.1 M20/M25/M40 family metallo-hydrolase [Faecalibacter bovis]
MNLKSTLIALGLLVSISSKAQDKTGFVYASMEASHARELKQAHPDQIDILLTNSNLSSVYIHPEVAHELHQKILSHGPGYLQHASLADANKLIQRAVVASRQVLDYTITEQEYVNQILNDVNENNIEEQILELENYGTRFHTRAEANVAAQDLKNRWEALIAQSGRQDDVSVRIVDHVNTPMKSVVLTINGNELASEYVIIGGHLDSTVSGSNKAVAPGADDNASGIATITEAARVLLNNNFKPKRTVEIMAYAAEEIGLVGSNEIATAYANEGKNVIGYVQFDMTAYKGSTEDVYLATDYFIDNTLNLFLIELMEEYNSTGNHQFTYGTTRCNYGCSDHYSWAMNSYPAAFPFEASFNESNYLIHTPNDTYTNLGETPSHSAKFTKLAIEFLVEAAKRTEILGTGNVNQEKTKFYVDQKSVGFEVPSNHTIKSATVINVAGQKVATKISLNNNDKINLNQLPIGAYILLLETTSGEKITHKFILK